MHFWLNPWMNLYKTPMNSLYQDISPVTSWWSPQFEFNFAGNRNIESQVVSEVASFGKQLGVISEALLEVAEGEKGEAVEKLADLVKQIEAVKDKHEQQLEQRIRSDLDRLKAQDQKAFNQLMASYK